MQHVTTSPLVIHRRLLFPAVGMILAGLVAVPAATPAAAAAVTAAVTTTVNPGADLSLTMTGPAQVLAGNSFTYNITVTNLGADSAGGTVVDDLPFGTFVATGTASAGSCVTTQQPNPGGFSYHDRVTCTLGALPAGESRTVSISLSANAAGGSGPVTNTASVSGADGDVNTANNSASMTTVFNPTDASVTVTGPTGAYTSDSFTDTVTVTNTGPATVSRIDLYLDASGAQILSATTAGNTCATYFTGYYCNFDGLTAGQNATVSVTLAAGQTGTAELDAHISLQSGYETTAQQANNTASHHTTVTAKVPTATLTTTGPVAEGVGVTVAFTDAFDPTSPGVDKLRYAFSCTNGDLSGVTYATAGSSSSTVCTFIDNGGYTLRGRVIDQVGGYSEYTTMVTVNNTVPTIGALSASGNGATACAGAGRATTLTFSFSDPAGANDTYTGSIGWGDGFTSSFGNSFSVAETHTYVSEGLYTITVNVADDDGGVALPRGLTFSNRYSMSAIQAPFNADSSSVFRYGSVVPVKVRITDCTGAAVPGLAPTVEWALASSVAPSGGINEPTSTGTPDTGNAMRYDPSAGQYIYNLATKTLPDGTARYVLSISEPHAAPQPVSITFGLRTK